MIPRLSRLFAFVLVAMHLSLGSASAQNGPVVIELYTSQGCSSCPPADKLLHELAERDDVIALALHVDYWDYIGWKDKFASPAHSERQRDYARRFGNRSVYTPQMIVNGQDSIVGARPMKLADAIQAHKAKAPGVALTLSRDGDDLVIQAKTATSQDGMVLHMLRYVPRSEVRITRGENAGRTLSYANVVQDWRVLAEWSGRKPLSAKVPMVGDAPVVVLVQAAGQGPILGAAQLR